MQRITLVLVVAALLAATVSSPTIAQAPTTGEKTYIELILDSSISMTARVEGSRSRLDVAKSVMEQIIRELPDDPNLQIALRIYGAELDPELAACSDSVLVQPFAPVARARQNMIDKVKSMKASGMTPIALSLEQAAIDFPDKKARNVIVLVTDGEESCGGDPCAVSARLQAQGLFLKPYVVGFALNEKQAALVRCIGDYFAASDTASLRQAMSTIMARAIAPAVIDVQAWAGGANVTRQANIQISKSTGEQVPSALAPQEPATLRAQVDEGTYTVRGWFLVGTQMMTAEVSGITAVSGKTSGVRLDFGSMEGTVRVTARSSGQDVSGLIGISALKSGQFVTANWTGLPPVAKLPAGDYTFIIAHRQYPQLTATATASVQPGKDTYVDVDLGQLPAALEVTVTYRGAVVSNMCQLTVATPGQPAAAVPAPADGRVFRYSSAPGTRDLIVSYKGLVTVEKAVRGVELVGGRTTPVEVKLDDVLGTLRVRVTAGGRDVTGEAKVIAARGDTALELPLAFGVREAAVPPAVYAATAAYRGIESDMYEANVKPGEVTELAIDVKLPGMIVIVPTIEGRPLDPSKLNAWAQVGEAIVGRASVQYGRVELSIVEGTYSVIGEISDPFRQRREVTEVKVLPGQTPEVKLGFDPAGLVRLRVIVDGAPAEAGAWVYFGGRQSGKSSGMPQVSKGVFELKVPEGTHDIEVDPVLVGVENQLIRDVEVKGGSTVERTLDLGGSGTLKLRVILDGAPAEAGAWAYFGGRQSGKSSGMPQVSKGVFELKVPEGTHDIEVDPVLVGVENQLIRDVEVKGGSTVERTLDLGGSGTLRLRVMLDGAPAEAGVWVYYGGRQSGKSSGMTKVAAGVWELKVPAGVHDIEIDPALVGIENKLIRDIEVSVGALVEKTIDLGGNGMVRLRVTVDGKPAEGSAWLYVGGKAANKYFGMRRVEAGLWELAAPEGIHDIEFDPVLTGLDNRIIRDVEVTAGGTVEKTLSLGGSGTVRLRVTVDGKPASGNAWLYLNGRAANKYFGMKRVEAGLWELSAPEGVHDIEFDPDLAGLDNQLVRDIQVVGGGTVEKTLNLGGSGVVRIRVIENGKPTNASAYLYFNGRAANKYAGMRKIETGLWELAVPAGTHDVEIDPELAGLDNQLIRDIVVTSGAIVERTLDLGGSGVVRIRVIENGKPTNANAYLYFNGRAANKYAGMRKIEAGLWELAVPAGTHDVELDPELAGLDNRLVRDIVVTGGAIVERIVDLGGSALLRVNFTYQGKPAGANVRVFIGGQAANKNFGLRKIQTGVYELQVPAGVHDIEIDPDASGVATQYIRNVEVKGGSIVERSLSL